MENEFDYKEEREDLCFIKGSTLDLFHKIRNDLVHLKKIANDFEKCLVHIKESIEFYSEIINSLEIKKENSDENNKANS